MPTSHVAGRHDLERGLANFYCIAAQRVQ